MDGREYNDRAPPPARGVKVVALPVLWKPSVRLSHRTKRA
jgi:hypothetical protein